MASRTRTSTARSFLWGERVSIKRLVKIECDGKCSCQSQITIEDDSMVDYETKIKQEALLDGWDIENQLCPECKTTTKGDV